MFLAKSLESQCLSTQFINGTSESEFNAGEGRGWEGGGGVNTAIILHSIQWGGGGVLNYS